MQLSNLLGFLDSSTGGLVVRIFSPRRVIILGLSGLVLSLQRLVLLHLLLLLRVGLSSLLLLLHCLHFAISTHLNNLHTKCMTQSMNVTNTPTLQTLQAKSLQCSVLQGPKPLNLCTVNMDEEKQTTETAPAVYSIIMSRKHVCCVFKLKHWAPFLVLKKI